ncbi:unnamed protein product [Brassica rapa]|uniref:Pentacotripeptide-repeat region of PRORP domain-containing protein n=1 Tax=Brassica campestris TaxID=3711 RepID=A0A3P5YNW2_BRACM|nr:unnamed protein product [Brassica rapa]VDC69372.1 unnamed protein product [Brassica rapa]
MMMMLLRHRTLPKSPSLLSRHFSSQCEDEKSVYRRVRSLIGSSELDKAVEYARSPFVVKSRRATRSAICELVVTALYDAKRYRELLSLIFKFSIRDCDPKLYYGLNCLNLQSRAREKRNLISYAKYEAEAKRLELNKCLVSNPPPYPIILGGDVIISPPKNQYYDESHLYSTVKLLIQNLSDLDTAVEYARFTAFTTTRTETTTATCDLIIAALCEAKRYMDAYHLFHYFFNQSNISLSVDCCNHIVKALCDDGHAHVALQLHHHDDAPLDYQTYRILTKALFLSGKIDEALDLVKDIFSLNNPDKYASVFLDQSDFDKAWALCCEEVISSNNVGCPTVTKTAVTVSLIEYHFSKGEDEKAMEIYTCLVSETSGKIEDASIRPLFQLLSKYGKETEAWSLNLRFTDHSEHIRFMMNQFFRYQLRMTDEAIDTLEKVRKIEDFITTCKFNHAPFSNVISRCCQDGNTLSHAKLILAGLLNKHDPSAYKVSTFQEMINAYLKAGRLDDALETANMMVDANLRLVSILMKS